MGRAWGFHHDDKASADFGDGHRHRRCGGICGIGAASLDWTFHEFILFRQMEYGTGFAGGQSPRNLQRVDSDWRRAGDWTDGTLWIGAD